MAEKDQIRIEFCCYGMFMLYFYEVELGKWANECLLLKF